MCDYSLGSIRNRLAVEGERLIVHRFRTGAKGLVSPGSFRQATTKTSSSFWRQWWSEMRGRSPLQERCPLVVCIPPGARLLLREIPEHFRCQFGVGPIEEVTFVQLSANAYEYRDAIRFENGREVLLQKLPEGQQVDVLCLSSREFEEDQHRRLEEEYRRVFAH